MEHFKGSRTTRSVRSSSTNSLALRPMTSTTSGHVMNNIRLIMISIFVFMCIACLIAAFIIDMYSNSQKNSRKNSRKNSIKWEGILDIFGIFLM